MHTDLNEFNRYFTEIGKCALIQKVAVFKWFSFQIIEIWIFGLPPKKYRRLITPNIMFGKAKALLIVNQLHKCSWLLGSQGYEFVAMEHEIEAKTEKKPLPAVLDDCCFHRSRNGRTDGRMDERATEQMNERTNGWSSSGPKTLPASKWNWDREQWMPKIEAHFKSGACFITLPLSQQFKQCRMPNFRLNYYESLKSHRNWYALIYLK